MLGTFAIPVARIRSAIFCSAFLFLLFIHTLPAQDSTGLNNRFTLTAYGDILYSHFDYGPDQKSSDNGSPPDSRAIVDLPHFELEIKYYFEQDLYVEAAVEYEHGGTGGALELEYEEFGEYEQEVEKGGEVLLEEFHLTKRFGPGFNVRIGHFNVPVGLLNHYYKPTQYFTAVRSESESSLLPSTWHETGVQVFGQIGSLAYRLGAVNGLDATGFDSKFWVRGGHQGRFEYAKATDMALFLRLDYNVSQDFLLGLAAYRGNSTANRPKKDMEGIDATVTVLDGHLRLDHGPFAVRAMALYGNLNNADLVSEYNLRLSKNLGVTRTPVAAEALAYYAELAYNIMPLLDSHTQYKLFPFVRYEYYDSMHKVDEGIFDVPRFERTLLTAGVNFFLSPQVVLKADYAMRGFGDSSINKENTFSIALGFYDTLLKL